MTYKSNFSNWSDHLSSSPVVRFNIFIQTIRKFFRKKDGIKQ